MEPQFEGQEVEQIKKELVFKGYPSIELSTRDKMINAIREAQFDKQNILWVASQKIHGSNFSIHCTPEIVKYGRRTDFLTKQIPIKCENPGDYFLESFYDARSFVPKIHNNLINVYQRLKKQIPELIKFSIYGEYFGGSWPVQMKQEKQFKAVQKGVYYTPYHEFMAFDIKIFTEKSVYWVDVLDIHKYLQDDIKSVPIFLKGTFDQVYAMQTKIDSTIPQLLGLEKQQKNIIEGMVLRPNINLSLPKNHERVILKKKNAEFNEIVSKPKENKKKEAKPISPEVVPYLDALDEYINNNRLESLMSKFPDEKNRKKLNEELIKDVTDDALKNGFEWPANEIVLKELKNQLSKKTIKAINDYFVHH